MLQASKIRDVAARHSYAFDNGISSPDFFDLDKRLSSEEFELLSSNCSTDSVLEIGCFTGLNLLGLGSLGFRGLYGVDFVQGAIDWLNCEAGRRQVVVDATCRSFPKDELPVHWSSTFNTVVCFDVLEHQLNVGQFLESLSHKLSLTGKLLVLVPQGKEYYDCGHTAFFPDEECLRNVLDYYFDVMDVRKLDTCNKLFAICARRS
jgi:2-polyprenyl-3-methyl-5-hydroxy-6-metoxy-1,4-benzoquinol methylase